ncbi:retrotransposon hot spot (RHS) protein [Trypanosoma cruzi]|nr:retrotransposon hot spot (RHS) protein [Trypanosoma cruzi]
MKGIVTHGSTVATALWIGRPLGEARVTLFLELPKMWEDNKALEYLARIVRVRGERNGESPFNAPMTAHLASEPLCMLAELMAQAEFNLFESRIGDHLIYAIFWEEHRVCIFEWDFHD